MVEKWRRVVWSIVPACSGGKEAHKCSIVGDENITVVFGAQYSRSKYATQGRSPG